MNLFNQIVPRLSRLPGKDQRQIDTAGESEYSVKPTYEVTETAEAWNVTAYLPGVTKEKLDLTAEEGRISIHGRRAWQKPDEWTAVYRESLDAPYELILEHDNTIEANNIQAELKDGVLKIALPKAEVTKPRKIAVN